jgi:ATP-dependent Clp protease ATP-binding subunit ClpA
MFERFTRQARVAVVLAQEEARELRTREIAPQHLLLGVLQAAGNDLSAVLSGYGLTADAVRARLIEACPTADDSFDGDAEALRAIGIDLHAVRDSVARTFGADVFDNALPRSGRRRRRRGHIPFTLAAKKSVELALREALARKDNEIACGHLLLGIMRSGDKAALGLITEHVYTAQLRASILALLDKAA